FIAFHNSTDEFMAQHWPEIAMVDYAFKILISLGLFVPMYGALLNHITRRLTKTAPQPSSSF
ncbi:MAG: 7-cyano-7-deazaguanine/7-aminomethyl-7-deazaguanine transporter, partial [Enterovibrio sp.]